MLKAAQRLLTDDELRDGKGSILDKTNYWGKRCAGCIIMADSTGRFLLPFRSSEVDDPDCYGTWGGAIDGSESPERSVRRELSEEAGYHGNSILVPLLVYRNAESGMVYHNFLCVVPEEFTPVLNWETSHAVWVPYRDWPNPMHPGLQSLFDDPQSMKTIQHYVDRLQ